MPAITIKGSKGTYIFSVVRAEYDKMPEWGGVYIAVNADTIGTRMQNCIAIGSCANFSKYAHKIQSFTAGKASHIYLLPEFHKNNRQFALEDLLESDAFKDLDIRILDDQMSGPVIEEDKHLKKA